MNDLAFVMQKMGNYDKAIEMHRKCLEERTKQFGELSKDTTQSMSNMATALSLKGELEEAKKVFKKAVECRNKIPKLGPGHPATLYTVSQYASTLTLAGDHEDAEKEHRRAINGLHKFFGKFMPDGRKHPLTLMAIHNMGDHLFQVGKHNEAMEILLEAYQGR